MIRQHFSNPPKHPEEFNPNQFRIEFKGEITNQSLDSTKANTRLGWRSEWSLKDGLK
ncbi:MAG: hypothetical protein WA915_01195 [Candidatus Aminicenantaceae bacterium]